MLGKLVLIRLYSFWDSISRGGRQAKAKSGKRVGRNVFIGIFAIYIFGMLGLSVGGMFLQLAQQMVPLGFGWIYFSYVAIVVLLFNFVGSVFAVQTQIHEAKDNDLLFAMPIRPRNILLSRILSLLVINYLYTIIFALPAVIVYSLSARMTAAHVIVFIISTLCLPFLALSISSLVGWLISIVTVRLRRKNLVSSIFMLIFFGFYMFFMMNINTYMQKLIENGEEIGLALKKVFPPAYSYGMAIANLDLNQFLSIIAFCLVPFAIVFFLLSKSFVKVATTKRGQNKIAYVEKGMKVKSPKAALLKKEWLRFSSLPVYMMNSALGVLFELVLAVYVIFNTDKLTVMLGEMLPLGTEDFILPFTLCLILGLLSVMNNTTSPSLSLEGKSFMLLKSLPVRPLDAFNAKIKLNLLIGIPSILIAGSACWFAFNLPPLQGLFTIILPLCAQCFAAVFGMFANISFPRFDWRNETVAIKQSASVVVSIFGGLAVFIGVAVIGFKLLTLISLELSLLVMSASLLLITGIFYLYIRTKGQEKFKSM